MKRLFILLVLVGNYSTSDLFAQKGLVDILMLGVTEIKYSNGGSASGVLVVDSNFFYLVTAKHCLVNSLSTNSINLVDTSFILVYYVGDPYSAKADTLLVNLAGAAKSNNLYFDPFQDIGIISIARITGHTPSGNLMFEYDRNVKKLTANAPAGAYADLLLDFDKVDVGNDCYIFGFPSSLQTNSKSDYDFDRPLLRKGVIAGKNKHLGTIIVDCPAYQGNSGGPVYAVSLREGDNIGLIGIVSRSVLHVETLENRYYNSLASVNYLNSGYTVIVPIEFARPLMKRLAATYK
jgi:hypothetical protein